MIEFSMSEYTARFSDASGNPVERLVQVRTDPVTREKSRITLSRALENERGTEKLYSPPAADMDEDKCPFCPDNLESATPRLSKVISSSGRMRCNRSVLFPNLFPYTEWSAVSLFNDIHHVEIGTSDPESYRDSLINCTRYLGRVKRTDSKAIYVAVTQNHLPGAGGSLVHPHLQVHATCHQPDRHFVLEREAERYQDRTGRCILSDLLSREKALGIRHIGKTGSWEWTAAFAPSGFYEIWGIAPGEYSLVQPENTGLWMDLAKGILNTQKFYRSLNRNAYNLALISTEKGETPACLRVRLTARASYAPWVRSDFTGFEMAHGDMATFTLPEVVAERARPFWKGGAAEPV